MQKSSPLSPLGCNILLSHLVAYKIIGACHAYLLPLVFFLKKSPSSATATRKKGKQGILLPLTMHNSNCLVAEGSWLAVLGGR